MTDAPHASPRTINLATLMLCVAVAVAVIVATGCSDKQPQDTKTLRLYAGAGMRMGVDALVEAFTAETGIEVVRDYGGSGMIISRARLDPKADLFMPGDVWYVDRLNEKSGLIESKTAIAYFVPVIIVRKGSGKNITGLEDLLRDDVRAAVGNPKACQIGRLTAKIFEKNNLDYSKLATKRPPTKESLTVNELGVWVKMDDVDAAVVWDAIAVNVADSVDIVEIPVDKNIISRVVVGLMRTSSDKVSAVKFIEFITSQKGRAILKAHGYRTIEP